MDEDEDSEPSWFSTFVQQLTGVMIIIIIAGGILICLLLFIFAKRQIVRFAIRSPRGINTPGTDASKAMRREINRRLEAIKKITYEPKLLKDTDDGTGDLPCHYYRMKTVDDSKNLEDGLLKKKLGKRQNNFESLRSYLISALCTDIDPRIIHQYCDLYEGARFNAKSYGEKEYAQFIVLLEKLRDAVSRIEPKRSTRSGSALNRDSLKMKPTTMESGQPLRRPKWTDKTTDAEGISLTVPLTESTGQSVHFIDSDSRRQESTQV